MAENRYVSDLSKVDWGQRLSHVFSLFSGLAQEVFHGFRAKTIPVAACCLWGTLVNIAIIRHWDYDVFRWLHLARLYPTRPFLFWTYAVTFITSGFWLWGFYQVYLRRKLVEQLTEVFANAHLKNALGRLPGFVFDRAIDEFTRKLRITRAHLPLEHFEKAKPALEAALQIYIDEIRENRQSGTIDIIYSHYEMPILVNAKDLRRFEPGTFLVGKTRAKEITSSFSLSPHLLTAGQTGGGKSSFLRQLITTLYLNDPNCRFTLIDLKGGLEFQTFENLPRVNVVPSVEKAIYALKSVAATIDYRMKLLKANKCKDIHQYLRLPAEKRVDANGKPQSSST